MTVDITGQIANEAPSNIPYVVAIVVMSLLGVVSVLGISLLRPTQDNTQLIATVLGFLLPTTVALLAFLQSSTTHKSVNSRMTEMMAIMKKASFAEGVKSAESMIVLPGPPGPVLPQPQINSGDAVIVSKVDV